MVSGYRYVITLNFYLRIASDYMVLLCTFLDSMEWTKPNTIGETPPNCRAHTATAYEKKLYIFGGGAGNEYYQSLYILDTVTRRWTHPRFSSSDPDDEIPVPKPRRAHSAVIYEGKLIIFGGGNGTNALNDVWVMDLRVPLERMAWQELETIGEKPGPRGYHTANIVNGIMVIVGGSDGKTSYHDIWCLHLGACCFIKLTSCAGTYVSVQLRGDGV